MKVLKGVSRGVKNVKNYTDKYIRSYLKDWYGEKNLIKLEDYVYIVHINGKYHKMQQSIPEIFFVDEAIPLNSIVSIKVETELQKYEFKKKEEIAYLSIEGDEAKVLFLKGGRVSFLDGVTSRVIEELLHWAE